MQIYLVGGAVRDQLLGLQNSDKDFCVVGSTPEEMQKLGYTCVGHDFPVFLHPKTKEEYALARTERKKGHGYKGFECYFSPDVTLNDDLARRDLTINSIAKAQDGSIIDPYGGVNDIKNKVLKHTSSAFVEDPLRVLRLARFYAKFKSLGFTVDPQTIKLCKEIANTGELNHLTPERIWQETEKALQTDSPAAYFEFLKETNALKEIFPELDTLSNVKEDPIYHPEGNTFAHSILTLNEISRLTKAPATRLAMMLHDIGKLDTKVTTSIPHEGHRLQASTHIKKLAKRIRMPKSYEKLAQAVAFGHTYVHLLKTKAEELDAIFNKCGGYQEPFKIAILTQCLVADYRGTLAPKTQNFMAPYFMQYIFNRAYLIKADIPISEGLTGVDIGKRLTELRQQAIKNAQQDLAKKYGLDAM